MKLPPSTDAASAHTHKRVDIVYLWVNGQDPIWQAKRRKAAATLNAATSSQLAPYSNVEGRFRDNCELRYNLRALERFFPDHGHIYIVTDGQTPVWLKPNAGLSIVNHSDLIAPQHLPTFDSGNIESYIHRIPDLSERYFYLNDDVFFGAPVVLHDWFFDNGIYLTWSHDDGVLGTALLPDSTALVNASRLSSQWLSSNSADKSYAHTPRTFAHSPRPMRKSMMDDLENVAPELFASVRSTVFRQWDKPSIVSDFVLRWALAHHQARLREHNHLHLSTGDGDASAQLAALTAHFGQLSFFCINDTLDDAAEDDARLSAVRETLAALLPLVSRFENI